MVAALLQVIQEAPATPGRDIVLMVSPSRVAAIR
jgi:hypothetical protein